MLYANIILTLSEELEHLFLVPGASGTNPLKVPGYSGADLFTTHLSLLLGRLLTH